METIIQALTRFLTDIGSGNPRSAASPTAVIRLSRDYLDGRAREGLTPFERQRFEQYPHVALTALAWRHVRPRRKYAGMSTRSGGELARKNWGILTASGGLMLMWACCNAGAFNNLVFQPLAFPFANAEDIARMAAFGIPNWSGSDPHNGIDLIVDENLESARIVSPTAGVVTRIFTNENPYSHPPGQLLVTIVIRINNEWSVYLVLEPGTTDPALEAAQLAAIFVREGQALEVGTPVADLVVGTLGYPRPHYMVEHNGEAVCACAHSSDAARAASESVSALPGSDLPDGNICYGQP